MGIKSDVLSDKNAFFMAIWASVSSPRPARNEKTPTTQGTGYHFVTI